MKNEPINDGGSAFPVVDQHSCLYAGMTLRDYFAGQAITGLLSSPRALDGDEMALGAYSIADAMIKARDAQ